MRRLLFPSCFAVMATAVLTADVDAQLMTMPLPPLADDQEVVVLDLAWDPGHASGPHRHNAHVFVYVIEGRIQMQVEGGELMTLGPGEMFYETPDDVHTVSRNASDTEPARILVHLIKTVGAPITTPVGN